MCLSPQAVFTVTILWGLLAILDIVKDLQGERLNFPLTIGLRAATFVVALGSFWFFRASRWLQEVVGGIVFMLGLTQVIFGLIEKSTLGKLILALPLILSVLLTVYASAISFAPSRRCRLSVCVCVCECVVMCGCVCASVCLYTQIRRTPWCFSSARPCPRPTFGCAISSAWP